MSVVLLAGSTGFVGQGLVAHLVDRGDRVVRLVRRPVRGNDEIQWDPDAGALDPHALEGVDAVVNLCGASIADAPWTARRRRILRASRVDPAHLLAQACARSRTPLLINASAIGIYGDRGEESLEEKSASGGGFLADLAIAWEHALRPAEEAGVRVVRMRLGMVLDTRGGALPWMSLAYRFCLGGPIGSGAQWMSWIVRDDAVRAFAHAIDHRLVTGPVLAVAPGTCRQRDFAKALGRALHRPAILPTPAGLVSFVLGERGRELLLHSQRCRPSVLTNSGFTWTRPEIGAALQEFF